MELLILTRKAWVSTSRREVMVIFSVSRLLILIQIIWMSCCKPLKTLLTPRKIKVKIVSPIKVLPLLKSLVFLQNRWWRQNPWSLWRRQKLWWRTLLVANSQSPMCWHKMTLMWSFLAVPMPTIARKLIKYSSVKEDKRLKRFKGRRNKLGRREQKRESYLKRLEKGRKKTLRRPKT